MDSLFFKLLNLLHDLAGCYRTGLLALIFLFVIATVCYLRGNTLEGKYTSPYTLYAMSSTQMWKYAFIVAFWKTIIIPQLGLAEPLLSPSQNQQIFPLFCGALWIIGLPFAVLFERWLFGRQLNRYHKMDLEIKQGIQNREPWALIIKLSTWAMNDEMKKFYREGYPVESQQPPEP